jgi:hypothetical protein
VRPARARAIAGLAVFVTWIAFLALYASGDLYCYDPGTGRSGIDALDACASHHPLGIHVTIADTWPFWSFAIVPLLLAVIWWPHRPWHRRGQTPSSDA